MEIKIIAFGSIAELTGREITVQASDVDSLKVKLQELFPELVDRKYAVAVNMKVVQENLELKQNDTVALMPPYSGG
jgi:molybdopterin converting factor small subunit